MSKMFSEEADYIILELGFELPITFSDLRYIVDKTWRRFLVDFLLVSDNEPEYEEPFCHALDALGKRFESRISGKGDRIREALSDPLRVRELWLQALA